MRYVPEKRNLGGRGLTLYLAGDDGRARAVAVIEYLQNISRISPEYLQNISAALGKIARVGTVIPRATQRLLTVQLALEWVSILPWNTLLASGVNIAIVLSCYRAIVLSCYRAIVLSCYRNRCKGEGVYA